MSELEMDVLDMFYDRKPTSLIADALDLTEAEVVYILEKHHCLYSV